jgi:hypothetical protein
MKSASIYSQFVMLSFLLGLFSCDSQLKKIPIFPNTDNPDIIIEPLLIPTNQYFVSYIVAKDKKQIYVQTFQKDIANASTVQNHLVVFDQNGNLKNDLPLKLNFKGGFNQLFYLSDGKLASFSVDFTYLIDEETFGVTPYKNYTIMAYPIRDENRKRAENESKAKATAQIEQLNQKYQLTNEEIKVENKKIPADYWVEYREIKSESDMFTEKLNKEFYLKFVEGLLPSQPLTGVKSGGLDFVMLDFQGELSCFDVKGAVFQHKINWQTRRTNSKVKMIYTGTSINQEGSEVADESTKLSCTIKRKTSSIMDDFSGKSTNDFAIKVEIGDKSGNFQIKNYPINIADDRFISLHNGNLIVNDDNNIYLIHPKK